MQISEENMDAVVEDFEYLSDNLPSAVRKLDGLLFDYRYAEDGRERAGILRQMCDVAEEIRGYADDAFGSFDGVVDAVDEALGVE